MEKTEKTCVIYNANCPVCSWEIDHYAVYADTAALPIRFDGLSEAGRFGLTPDQAARRLNVLHKGQILSGIPAFLVLWQQMPRYRGLAVVVGLPGIRQIAAFVYDHIAAPLLYRAHLRRIGL